MDVRIIPAVLRGSIPAISSKSYAQRTLIAAALSERPTEVYINNISKDIQAVISALTGLGAKIEIEPGKVTVNSGSPPENPVVFCGESGTAARLLLPVAAAICDSATICGEGSLINRPFEALIRAMEQNGCCFKNETLPISFGKGIRPGDYTIRGDESSQYISGLLFALPLLDGKSKLTLTTPLQSSGYVNMTIETLEKFGIRVKEMDAYEITGKQKYSSPGEIMVERDWSNAAFWLAAGVEVTGLNMTSLQKDRQFTDVRNLNEIDATEIPDLVPILSVCAAVKEKETRIHGISRLRIKESDRVKSVEQMLISLGAEVTVNENEIIIRGKKRLRGGTVESFNDHRIVMSAAIASCFCENEVIIRDAVAVEKSYPDFFEDFNLLGGNAYVV